MSPSLTALAVLIPAAILYTHLLSKRLSGPHPLTDFAKPDLSPEALDAASRYDHINVLDGIPKEKTGKGYAVVGGSGLVGEHLVRLLLLRGETRVRILDVNPAKSSEILGNPRASFIKTDITSLESVRNGLATRFADGTRVEVIYSVAAAIRFWDRLSYTWDATYQVNVRGTQNIVIIAQELQAAKGDNEDPVIVIYTSSTDTGVTQSNPLLLSWGPPIVCKDENPDLPVSSADRCYMRSKLEAEAIVKKAHTPNGHGLKTGIIRPGNAITGPGDFTTMSLFAAVPTGKTQHFDGNWGYTNVCVWDVASAHILLEDAIRKEATLEKHLPGIAKEKIGGTSFFVSGPGKPWKTQDFKHTLVHFIREPLQFGQLSPLMIFVIAHGLEGFLYLRYHLLLGFHYIYSFISSSPSPFRKPSLDPAWLGIVRVIQPATLKMWIDVKVDHSRAERLLGYKPLWQTEQYCRWAIEGTREMMAQSKKTGTKRPVNSKMAGPQR